MRINEYTYNDDGTLLKVTSYNKRTKKLVQEITYTYENGLATHYSSTGQYYEFEADLKYDADGNKIEEYQYAKSGENVKPRQRETWTFTDGVLTLYMKYRYDSKGAEVADSKKEYVPVENNMNVMDVSDYTYNSVKDTWNKWGLTVRQTYRDFSGMKEATQTMLLSATPDKKLKNTINLQFTAPKAGLVHGCKFVVYRDCVALDTLDLADVMDPATKQCSYQDKELKSDTYTYFVQPLFRPHKRRDRRCYCRLGVGGLLYFYAYGRERGSRYGASCRYRPEARRWRGEAHWFYHEPIDRILR